MTQRCRPPGSARLSLDPGGSEWRGGRGPPWLRGPVASATAATPVATPLQEIVELHPDLVQEALLKVQAQPMPNPDGVSLSAREATKTGARSADSEGTSAKGEVPPVSSPPPASKTECRPATAIPYHRYAAQFVVETQQERKEVEVAASQFMDGFNNGADWVYRDRRYGTVMGVGRDQRLWFPDREHDGTRNFRQPPGG